LTSLVRTSAREAWVDGVDLTGLDERVAQTSSGALVVAGKNTFLSLDGVCVELDAAVLKEAHEVLPLIEDIGRSPRETALCVAAAEPFPRRV